MGENVEEMSEKLSLGRGNLEKEEECLDEQVKISKIIYKDS